MNIVLLLIATYPVTIVNNVIMFGTYFKDVANSGLVINQKEVLKDSEERTSKLFKFYEFTQLVPLLNIACSTLICIGYGVYRSNIINSLKENNHYERMSIDDYNQYKEHPTICNAAKMHMEKLLDIDIADIQTLDLSVINGEGKIYYIIKNNNIIIIGGEGFAELLTEERKKEIIKNFAINKKVNNKNNTCEEEGKQTGKPRTRY